MTDKSPQTVYNEKPRAPEGAVVQMLLVLPNSRRRDAVWNALRTSIIKGNVNCQANMKVIRYGDAIMAHRFNFIMCVDDPLDTIETRRRNDQYVHESLRCRLVPGGELVWM